ncbi:MAG: hypothetical protein RLZZ165_905 [Bacteroidota bacterium]|jgi:predicted dinucleotide-binding enzyme
MKIAIIGAGNVGSALGKGWIKRGHQVVFGIRDASSPKSEKASREIEGAEFQEVQSACDGADVVVVTTPADVVADLVPLMGPLEGKVVIDTTNAIRMRPEPYATGYHAIVALSKDAAVVKCFNTTGFENMANPSYHQESPVPHSVSLDMFMAGGNSEAKKVARQLALDLGFEACWDFGGEDKVELLEKFALSWINLAILQGHGREIAFKVIRRQ